MKTTLNKIRADLPCPGGWETLLNSLNKTKPDDEELSILTILNSNGFSDALWCLRSVKNEDKKIRLYVVWCARQVQHLMTDQRSIYGLDVAEKFANGEATEKDLADASVAAHDAFKSSRDYAAKASHATSYAAANAAYAAYYATSDSADAADHASTYSAHAIRFNSDVDRANSDYVSMRSKQEAEFRRICSEEN